MQSKVIQKKKIKNLVLVLIGVCLLFILVISIVNSQAPVVDNKGNTIEDDKKSPSVKSGTEEQSSRSGGGMTLKDHVEGLVGLLYFAAVLFSGLLVFLGISAIMEAFSVGAKEGGIRYKIATWFDKNEGSGGRLAMALGVYVVIYYLFLERISAIKTIVSALKTPIVFVATLPSLIPGVEDSKGLALIAIISTIISTIIFIILVRYAIKFVSWIIPTGAKATTRKSLGALRNTYRKATGNAGAIETGTEEGQRIIVPGDSDFKMP